MTARILRAGAVLLVVAALTFGVVLTMRGLQQHEYSADFTHASNLEVGEEVRVAGLPVGEVTDIELVGGAARVTFRAEGVEITDRSEASVELATLLGTSYLAVDPGDGEPLGDEVIPTDRTTPAYTVDRVVDRTQQTAEELDLDAVQEAMTTISTELDQDPQRTDRALDGVTSLARLVADKDQQLGRLLEHVREVTDMVLDQQGSLESIIDDAETVTAMVSARRDVIARLLTRGRAVLEQVQELERTTQADVDAVARSLEDVLGTLRTNDAELGLALERLAPMARYFSNATGNGPWIDVYAPYFLIPDNLVCLLPGGGCS